LKRIIKADKLHELGFGTIMEGNLQLLTGFSFNHGHKLKYILKDEPAPFWGMDTLTAELWLPVLSPGQNCKWPKGADYVQMTTQMTYCDLDDHLFETCYIKSGIFPCTLKKIDDTVYNFPITKVFSNQVMVLSLGIEFLGQDSQGVISKWKRGLYDSFDIISVKKEDFTTNKVIS
jgi:hypothetical protein